MEAPDVAEQVREVAADEWTKERTVERFRTRAAIAIAVLAMLLAIATLGGEDAATQIVNANIHASDTWAFYQAKNIRQTSLKLAVDELDLLVPLLPPEQQAAARQKIARYQADIARYESEPDPNDPGNPLKGEGKKELFARARDWEAKRDHAQAQDPNFDYSTALYQIAIVLGSIAIVATSRRVFALALVLGAVATALMLNGFFLFFELPFG